MQGRLEISGSFVPEAAQGNGQSIPGERYLSGGVCFVRITPLFIAIKELYPDLLVLEFAL